MEGQTQADTIIRTTRSLGDPKLRHGFLVNLLSNTPVALAARALDCLCARAEQADVAAREVLVAVVDALNAPALAVVTQRLREEAAGESLLALDRLVRTWAFPHPELHPAEAPVPDYGKGRPLTLGERKSLARRPTRELMCRLLADPHPDVIRQLLTNPRVVEDDVMRLAAKRPVQPELLVEIARSTRWAHRPRIRMALVLNPHTPFEISGPLVGLLVRQELVRVSQSTHVPQPVRALCLEHLARRPPASRRTAGDGGLQ